MNRAILMAGVILSITVFAIGSITPALAPHSTVDVLIVLEHTKRGILAMGFTDDAECVGQSCNLEVDIDNDKEIKRINRICPTTDGSVRVVVGRNDLFVIATCTQGPFTVTIIATLDTTHDRGIAVLSQLT